MGFVDLHSHVLYGLDDGAPDEKSALAMLDGLAALGITEQCVTPHQKASQYLPAWDLIESTLAKLETVRKSHHPTLRLAAENMWDDVFYQRAADNTIPGYRDTVAFLVEIPPPLMPPGMIDQMFKWRMAGKVPVLAHPERYHALWDNDDLAEQLRKHCAFVVDLGALGGFHGRREQKAARHLLERGLATAVATDAHQLGDLQQAAEGLRWIEKKLGHATVVRLFDHAPRAILSGELPRPMKLAINLALSLGMLALCMWLVWPDAGTRTQLAAALKALEWREFAPYLFGYIGLLVIIQLTRSLRWNYLLAPLGVRIPTGPLLAISSVGFMAILALPARLGEFVRPGLMRKRGISASAALGTVFVERIVDGLLVSLFVFVAFFALHGPQSPGWMMPTAYAALGIFALALVFLIGALKWPVRSVRLWLKLSLLPRFAPRLAQVIETKALDMIRGFEVMRDTENLAKFVAWSLVYWTCNGLGVYVLAKGFNLELTLVGAFATMGLVAVGITLPNSPGLVGQFQWFTLLGLSLYIPGAATKGNPIYGTAFAFANVHYGLQVAWYVACGALGLATRYVSFHDLWDARRSGGPTKTGPGEHS